MILFWRGWGWLVVPVAVAPLLAGVILSHSIGWTEEQGGGAGLLLGGVAVTLFAFIFLPSRARKGLGFWHIQRVHTFMFIPLVVWAPIVMVLGVVMMLTYRDPI